MIITWSLFHDIQKLDGRQHCHIISELSMETWISFFWYNHPNHVAHLALWIYFKFVLLFQLSNVCRDIRKMSPKCSCISEKKIDQTRTKESDQYLKHCIMQIGLASRIAKKIYLLQSLKVLWSKRSYIIWSRYWLATVNG